MSTALDLLAHFPAGATPRAEQRRLLAALDDAMAEALEDPAAPRVFLVEGPPGVGKSHVAMTLARWSGDAYLLTSQKLLQDQYEREFGGELQIVKGRDNYACDHYPGARVPTSRGLCRRPRGPLCQCPYVRAKTAALGGPIFCTNTAYFATLRHWHAEHLRKRRLLIIDEAHNLESQLVSVFTVAFPREQMQAWFAERLMTVPLIATAQVRILEEEVVDPVLAPDRLPDDLLPSITFDCFFRSSTTASTACSIPRFRPIGLAPAATFFRPSRTIA